MISVTILTCNSERYLEKVLDSTKTFDEVVILDENSSDKTLDIAKQFPNVKVHSLPEELKNTGFGKRHNYISSLAKNDWILSLDSDEVLSTELVSEVHSLKLTEDNVYSLLFRNHYKEKCLKHCGSYFLKRIYNRKKTEFSKDLVHEQIISTNMKEIKLKNHVNHYSFPSSSVFLEKIQKYSELFAKQNMGKKKSSPIKAIMHGIFAFIKTFILKMGFLDGYGGIILSIYQANNAFYKYLKLYELNK